MKLLFKLVSTAGLLLCLTLTHANDSSILVEYSISPKSEYCLSVKSKFEPLTGQTVTLSIPSTINTIHFDSSNILNHKKLDDHLHEFTLKQNSSLTESHEVCYQNAGKNPSFPIISPDFFHFIVGQILLTPNTANNIRHSFLVNLEGFPNSLSFANSFTTGESKTQVNASTDDFLHAIFSGGHFAQKRIFIKGNPVYIVTQGHNPDSERQIESDLKAIISQQRDFWNDHHFPHFVALLIHHELPKYERRLYGTHGTNFLTMAIPNYEPFKLPVLLALLSHEHFHGWNGLKMKFPLPQGKSQWFLEGLTDFYGIELLRRSGMISTTDYLNFINSELKDYTLSPVKFADNQTVANNFNRHPVYRTLSKNKGLLIFLQLANNHKQTDAKLPLLDLIVNDLYQQYQNSNASALSDEMIDAAFSKYLSEPIWLKYKNNIISEQPITLSPYLLDNEVKLVEAPSNVPYFEFDLNKFITEGKFIPIEDDPSPALKQILTAGTVIGLDLDYVHADVPAKLQVVDAQQATKILLYTPQTKVVDIPHYKLCLE